MRIVIKMAIESDDGYVAPEMEVLRMDRGADAAIAKAGLGLTMLEAKATLAAVQKEFVAAQAEQIVVQSKVCPDCGAVRKEKDSRHVVYRTLFGKLRLRSPRLLTCPCQGKHSRQSFSPLADGLTARSHPELLYLTTRWASIISYGAGRTLLDDILPIGAALSCSAVRNAVRRIGKRLDEEATVKDDDAKVDRATWTRAHRVDGTHQLAVELDAGYIRSNDPKNGYWLDVRCINSDEFCGISQLKPVTCVTMNSQTCCQTDIIGNCSAVVFHALSFSLILVSNACASFALACIGVMDSWACPACDVSRPMPESRRPVGKIRVKTCHIAVFV